MPDTQPNEQDATINGMRATIEDMSVVGSDALRTIAMLATLALHECDRGPGKIHGQLIVSALGEIVYRATDACDSLDLDAEKWGFGSSVFDVERATRSGNLNRSCAPGVSSNVLGGE